LRHAVDCKSEAVRCDCDRRISSATS
jgi:hypothetical protein